LLIAHLAADEPRGNAELACSLYLESQPGRGPLCRPLTAEDLLVAPFAPSAGEPGFALRAQVSLATGGGRAYRIELVAGRMRIDELRWCRVAPAWSVVSLRDVVGDLEDYQPACATTLAAVRAFADAPVSTSVLAVELARVQGSAIVLNRRLREAVVTA